MIERILIRWPRAAGITIGAPIGLVIGLGYWELWQAAGNGWCH